MSPGPLLGKFFEVLPVLWLVELLELPSLALPSATFKPDWVFGLVLSEAIGVGDGAGLLTEVSPLGPNIHLMPKKINKTKTIRPAVIAAVLGQGRLSAAGNSAVGIGGGMAGAEYSLLNNAIYYTPLQTHSKA
jgi:hypothetical protein